MTWTPGPDNSPPPERARRTSGRGDDASAEGDDAAADRDDALARLANDARTDDRVAERRRRRWLRRQAAESSTLAGVLLTLMERGSTVTIRSTSGTSHRGRITTIGVDVVVLGTGEISPTVIALAHVAGVGTGPGVAVDGDREANADGPLLRDVLAGMADDEPLVRVTTLGGAGVVGVLRWVGDDVVALTLGPEDRPTAATALNWTYVRLSSLTDVSPSVSG